MRRSGRRKQINGLPHLSSSVRSQIGEHTQAGRWIKFTSLREIAAVRSALKDYLYEAIELEESGTKMDLKKPSEHPIPEELQRRLDDNAVLRSAFAMLTPGWRKSYMPTKALMPSACRNHDAISKMMTTSPMATTN
jgi:uncharacterized protein YdeI (YjbR/CyaY-like superfamily)